MPSTGHRRVPIAGAPSVGELNTRLFLAGARALPAALERLAVDCTAGEPQNLSEGQYLGYPTAGEMAGFGAQAFVSPRKPRRSLDRRRARRRPLEAVTWSISFR